MDKKVERILAWIANGLSILYFLIIGLGGLFLRFSNEARLNNIMQQATENQSELTSGALMTTLMLYVFIILLSTLYGVVGILMAKGRPKLSGALLIIAAIIGVPGTNLIASLLWFIAGIMLLAKNNNTQKRNSQYHDFEVEHEVTQRKKQDPYIY